MLVTCLTVKIAKGKRCTTSLTALPTVVHEIESQLAPAANTTDHLPKFLLIATLDTLGVNELHIDSTTTQKSRIFEKLKQGQQTIIPRSQKRNKQNAVSSELINEPGAFSNNVNSTERSKHGTAANFET